VVAPVGSAWGFRLPLFQNLPPEFWYGWGRFALLPRPGLVLEPFDFCRRRVTVLELFFICSDARTTWCRAASCHPPAPLLITNWLCVAGTGARPRRRAARDGGCGTPRGRRRRRRGQRAPPIPSILCFSPLRLLRLGFARWDESGASAHADSRSGPSNSLLLIYVRSVPI